MEDNKTTALHQKSGNLVQMSEVTPSNIFIHNIQFDLGSARVRNATNNAKTSCTSEKLPQVSNEARRYEDTRKSVAEKHGQQVDTIK